MHPPRVVLALAIALAPACLLATGLPPVAPLQQSQSLPAQAWVTRPVDPASRRLVRAPSPSWKEAAADAGPVSPSLEISRVTVVLRRPLARQAGLDAFLSSRRSASPPPPLSPLEVGRRFGASRSDVEEVSRWLEGEGLVVDGVEPNQLHIRVHGPASSISRAFGTSLRYFTTAHGEARIANASLPSVPAALAPAIASVQGLAMMPLRPMHRLSSLRPQVATPGFSRCDGDDCFNVLFPADFTAIYNLAPVYAAGIKGQGQTVAVIGRSRVNSNDILQYQARAGLSPHLPHTLIVPGGVDPGAALVTCGAEGSPGCTSPDSALIDQLEATLDVQRAAATAPMANILLLSSASTETTDGIQIAIEYAINANPVPAHVMSVSFGTCEADNDPAVASYLDDLFAQAAAEGISVMVSSGDSGAAGCEDHSEPPGSGQRRSANLLCASGHVTCVGGTEFSDKGPGDQAAYWSADNGSGFASARGYIPEGAWNEPLDGAGNTRFSSTGGGVSPAVARPSWQEGIGLPAAGGRYTPDVSLAASSREGYFLCFAALGAGCDLHGTSFNFFAIGGTSASAPGMAGIAALINQKAGAPQGGLNPRLYAMAGDEATSSAFHDTTPASSGVEHCSLSQPGPCNNSTPGPRGLSGGVSGYALAPGYDPATGLGSVDVARLLDGWDSLPPLPAPSINLNQHGITGSWANLETDSQGFLVEVFPDAVAPGTGMLFAGWFTYGASASDGWRWYTIQGDVSSAGSAATLPIYQTTGGTFSGGATVRTQEVGTATLSLEDCSRGTLAYAFDDGTARHGVIPLVRLVDNVTCSPDGDSGAAAGSYLWSGSFGAAGADGQGFIFDFNPIRNLLFAAWYTFTPSPAGGAADQRWFTIQSPFTPGITSLDGLPIYASSGGTFDAPASTTTVQVGTASLRIDGCDRHLLRYTFESGEMAGLHGVLSNHRVGPVPAGCAL